MGRRGYVLTAVTVAVLTCMSGCKGDDRIDANATTSSSTQLHSSASNSTPTTAQSETTTTLATAVTNTSTSATPAKPGPVFHHELFSSPSRNIGCGMYGDDARCDIREQSWSNMPPKPADCELDYGQGLIVWKGERGTVVCAGDTVLGSPTVLAYGAINRVGDFECVSEEAGMSCRNTKTAHGFVIARTNYKVF